MFKKILYGVSSAVLFASCSSDRSIESDYVPQPPVNTERKVSFNQAKSFANLMANNLFSKDENGIKLYSSTADEQRSSSDIRPIVYKGKDTVMYTINFGNDLGYMILSADKGSFPIVAYSDSGSFDNNTLNDENSPISSWFKTKSESTAINMSKSIDTTSTGYGMWSSLDNENEELEIKFVTPSRPTTEPLAGRRKYSTGKSTIRTSTGYWYNWGQGSGYNFNAKVKNAPIGCPAVAIGLLSMHHTFPNKYVYWRMPFQLKGSEKENAISLMFRDIADNIPNYSWNVSGSGATPNNITIGLKKLGYKNATLSNYNLETVYSNLINGNPVLLAGFPSQGSGHIWFCDGYYEAAWTVTRYIKIFGKRHVLKRWSEYADFLYMNWGWNGTHNGWFDHDNWNPGVSNYNYHKLMFVNLYPVHN